MREDMKQSVVEISGIIRDKRLTDNAGGNISIRDGDTVCITPKYAGFYLHWKIKPEHLLITNVEGAILDGSMEMSREGSLHLGLYREFPDAGAVIHAHPYWINVFVASAKSIKPTLEYTTRFGSIECIEKTAACTEELARQVIDHFKGKNKQWSETAVMTLAPYHGVVAMGRDIYECFDILESIETECRCQILGRLLKQ